MKKDNRINISIRDERLIDLIKKFCKTNNLTYVEFITGFLNSFFEVEDRLTQLSMKTREELVDMIMEYEERNKK